LSFYDPRRGKRYWASRHSKHDTLAGALQALADQYGRSAQWVASHMGEENNLSKIHASLIQRREMETSTKETQQSNQASAQRFFYDDGRQYPYHIGPGRDFKTRKAALEALAKQYHQSEQWVNRRIGDLTDLDAVHRILEQAAANKPEQAPKSISSEVTQDSEAASNNGLEFYNPRREQKYWTGKMARHNTLQEAMKALAEQYGVSTEWVESNMGNTNDLDTIHRNIRKSLQ
jgi:ribonuclease HI